MRKFSKSVIYASAVALAATAAPTLAEQQTQQPATAPQGTTMPPTTGAGQQGTMNRQGTATQRQNATTQDMAPEKQAEFNAWPEDTKVFYSSLSREQQKAFWDLSDDDKVALSRMDPQQRNDIMRQLEERKKAEKSSNR